MDLRTYYSNIRAIEAQLEGDPIVVVSLATPEGGKAGVCAEVPRAVAARMIAETRSRVADDHETKQFHAGIAERRRLFELDEEARRMRVMVIPANDLRREKERS